MTEFPSPSGPLPHIPDNLTVSQFIFDYAHPSRPARPRGVPWLVEDHSGKALGQDELRSRTDGLASSLHTRYSIGENDVVLLFSGNHIDYPVCIWATLRLLAVVSPCNPAFTVPEIIDQLRKVKATLIIAQSSVYETVCTAVSQVGIPLEHIVVMDNARTDLPCPSVDALIREGEKSLDLPTDKKLAAGEGKTRVAFLSSSSGTTGPPKIVKISHFALIANVIQIAAQNKVGERQAEQRYRPGDAVYAVLPFYHIYGLDVILHFALFAGMSVVVVPKFHFTDMLSSIVRHRITHLMVVPPQVVLLCKDPIVKNYDLSRVRVVLCAASPLPLELYEQLTGLLPQAHIGQAYGSTEGTGVVSMHSISEKQNRFGGVFVPGVVGKVVKADGSLATFNEEGELLIKTPAAALGYLDNEIATRETFIDGWLRTGDQVMVDEKGNVIVVDRIKEIIKVRGFQVAPAELEGCIIDHPLAADVCVVGVPDNFSGELPLAFVVPSAEAAKMIATPGGAAKVRLSITKHVAENKAAFKHLARVEFLDAIPKTPSGKLLRRDLREKARQSLTMHTLHTKL